MFINSIKTSSISWIGTLELILSSFLELYKFSKYNVQFREDELYIFKERTFLCITLNKQNHPDV